MHDQDAPDRIPMTHHFAQGTKYIINTHWLLVAECWLLAKDVAAELCNFLPSSRVRQLATAHAEQAEGNGNIIQ